MDPRVVLPYFTQINLLQKKEGSIAILIFKFLNASKCGKNYNHQPFYTKRPDRHSVLYNKCPQPWWILDYKK